MLLRKVKLILNKRIIYYINIFDREGKVIKTGK